MFLDACDVQVIVADANRRCRMARKLREHWHCHQSKKRTGGKKESIHGGIMPESVVLRVRYTSPALPSQKEKTNAN
jgi:hypothetical protein